MGAHNKIKKDSKKFIKFSFGCVHLVNGRCCAIPVKSDCFQKKCKLFKSKYKGLYFGKTRQFFKSDEELEFYCWLCEAKENGLIGILGYEPVTFKLSGKASVTYEKQLKTKIKICDKHLFAKHSYSPDFRFDIIDTRLYQYFINTSYFDKETILVDVKGGWSRDNSAKAFSINQKWVYKVYDEYVEKVVPEKLFIDTWVPEIAMFSPVKKDLVKKYCKALVIGEFIKLLEVD